MARSWNSATSPSSSQSHSGEEREETEYLHDDSPIQEEDVRAEIPEDEMVDECLERYQDIYEDTFDEMRLPIDVVEEVRQAFSSFIQLQSSKDAAGEAIYAAVFDAAPSLQNLFKTPRSVMSLRFMNGIISILNLADDPAALKAEVQSVGFRHLDREVTPPRAAVFRDAIADLLDLELPNGLSSKARLGLQAILNYAAGSFIYIRKNYSTRVRVIQRSWRIVNNKAEEGEDGPQDGEQATKTVDDFTDDKKSKSFDNSNGSSREEVGRKDSKKPTDLKAFEALRMDEEEFQDATNEVATEDLSIAKYQTVQDGVLEEVRFPKEVVEEAQQAWSAYTMASTKEAAGEMLYAAIFNVAPSLQGLFKIPRPTMAARFMNSINAAVAVAHRPSALKGQAEALGFQHFDIEVTSTRGDIFREAILEVLDMELGARFTTRARMGLAAIMNYLIGANIFVRREYADRIHVLQQSWKMANEQALSAVEMAEQEDALYESAENLDEKRSGAASPKTTDVQVPTSFTEMFHFNAAVMGFNSDWMNSVLFSLNDLVAHAAASYRLNEECAVLSLVLAQQTQPAVLSEFKAVMLASLRSLVAKEWSSQHEIAWSWFWENVMRILKSENFKPQVRLQALENFLLKLSPAELSSLHRNVFKKFFELAPKGQDYFKQSIERLNYIVDQILAMSIDIYREPREMVRKISALGLRHVGYAIPTELFPPFVSGSIEVIRSMTTDEATESAFRWSLTLISKILVRSINEGSTVVMKAVNTNQEKALRLAVSMAPRGKRNMEMLNVAVGTESISPLYWAIETGSSQVAKAMIIDLLTIRADRDNYYYGNEALFTRHPDIIQKLCVDGPSLLWPLLDGLIWRSRMVSQGMRRVNYYIQHLVQDAEGNMNKALKWMAAAHDPKLIAHPIAEFFSDLMWERLVSYRVFVGKIYLVFGLLIFILGHALYTDYQQLTDAERVFVFVCRGFNYSATMLQLFIRIIFQIIADIRRGQIVRIYRVPFPKSLCSLREMGYLLLIAALSCCCALEPILWCFNNMEGDFPGSGLFTSTCPEGAAHHDAYSLVAGVAMVLYWLLAIDISIFSMRISAFFLVCFQVLVEFWLYLLGLSFLIIAFATSLSALNHEIPEVTGIDQAALTLLKVSLSIYPAEKFAELEASGWVFVVVCIFLLLASMFLLNLLVAQVSEAYAAIVTDMYGYARLSRAGVIVSIIEKTSSKRWNRFLMSLNFDKPLEFNEGDIGLAGGMSILEPASANPTPVDRIKRYGGTTSSEKPWPEEPERLTDEDKFLHLEKLILRMSKRKRRHHGGGSNASSQGTGDDANTNTISTQETQETQESAEVSE